MRNKKAETKFWKIVLVLIVILFVLGIFVRVTMIGRNPAVSHAEGVGVKYGEDRKQSFDFYAPVNGGDSDVLVVVVHGGAWIGGDKNYMSGAADYFSKQDYSVVNMNYRFVPEVNVFEQLEDLENMLNYISSRQSNFKLTPGYEIVLIGHSAGAHLSAFYGVDENKYGGRNIDYVIGLAGPYDLNIPGTNPLSAIVREKVVANYGVEAVSPISNIEQGDKTKFLLILGSEDDLIPEKQLTNFEKELQNRNVYVESLIVEGKTHNSIVDVISKDGKIADRVFGFLEN